MRALPLAVAAALLVAGCGGEEESAKAPLGRKIAARASVHVFAEPVRAELEVVVDRDQLDPDRVRIETRFLPYDVKAEQSSSEERGRFTVLRREYVLRCLRIACIPDVLESAAGGAETGRGERRTIQLRPARVLYERENGKTRFLRNAPWPEVVSVSRLKESDVPEFGRFVFKTSVAPLPPPDYRVSPTALGIGLLFAALAVLALPAVLVARWYRRRRPEPSVEPEPELTPLERAIRIVEWAGGRESDAERREALEVLAVELDAESEAELARSTRTLAWSPTSPSPERAAGLVAEVRGVVGAA
jgi:hypothetical protein